MSTARIDRHLPHKEAEVALVFGGDDPGTSGPLTYGQLHHEVCLMANVLKG